MLKLMVIALLIGGEPTWPGDHVTDEMRNKGIKMLKKAYRLNGNSMNNPDAFKGYWIYTPIQDTHRRAK